MQTTILKFKHQHVFTNLKWLLLGLIFMSSFIATQAQTRGSLQTNNPVPLRDGIVINVAQNEIYITDKASNISAIDIVSGRAKWTSEAKGRPLAMLKGKLIVQLSGENKTQDIRFGEVDVRNGRITKQANVKAPKSVNVSVKNNVDGSFSLVPYVINDNIYFEWSYQPPVRGYYDEKEEQKNESGAILYNGSRYRTISLDDLPKGYNNKSILATKQQRVDTDNAQQFVSKDGKHLLLSTKDLKSTELKNYTWEIYEIATKRRMGRLNALRSYAAFIVVKDTLILEQQAHEIFNENTSKSVPLQLIGYSLKDNKILWEKEILNTHYTGPTPP